MSQLPDAVPQNPECGACHCETDFHDYGFVCHGCQLFFHGNDLSSSFLSAAFIDPDAEPCGSPCNNFWHGDHKIQQGIGFDCRPCQLPAGHVSLHWTGCQQKNIGRR